MMAATKPVATSMANSSETSMQMSAQDEIDLLSNEVSALSTKLILAVERQADLEDGLAATRHELEQAQVRIRTLEETQKRHADMKEKGLLVERKDVELETSTLMKKLMEESKARMKAESDRRSIEQEVEDLTRSLFEEANKMVSSARMENGKLEHKNRQLENIIQEKDNILFSLQEQLTALKKVLQEVADEQEHGAEMSEPTSPSASSLSASMHDDEESQTTEESKDVPEVKYDLLSERGRE
ncbi:hypothetical protein V1517DRAFT_328428 [Lipomyces orientalis]|uniref:Uncharacterized protein n=1 Tax=Lipomyces orientalis TaxID=1233043 RepID=A0ACC3TKX1_9ASCO